MAQMSREALMEYIKHAIELESSIVTQEQAKDIFTTIREKKRPTLSLREKPSSPKLEGYNEKILLVNIIIFISVGLVCLVCGPDLCFNNTPSSESLPLVIVSLITALVCGIILYTHIHSVKAENEVINQNYYTSLVNFKKKNEELSAQYNSDCMKWSTSNNEVYTIMDENMEKSRKVLEDFYGAADIIFPKYHNLPALTSIYEYLQTERCYELSGPHGAYNLYEDELRKDIIITQMNVIIQDLEQIKRNQFMLYEELKSIQRNTHVIATEMDNLVGLTIQTNELVKLNAFYSGINALNSSSLAYIATI